LNDNVTVVNQQAVFVTSTRHRGWF